MRYEGAHLSFSQTAQQMHKSVARTAALARDYEHVFDALSAANVDDVLFQIG